MEKDEWWRAGRKHGKKAGEVNMVASNGETWLWGVLRAIGVAIILVCVIAFGWFVVRDYQARSWPSTTGQVVATHISHDATRRAKYYPQVSYRYEVGGRRFESDRIWLNSTEGFRYRSDAREAISAFRAEGPVTVFYDPEHPERSILIHSDPPWAFLFGVGVGVLLIGARRFFAWPPRRPA